MFRFFSGFIHSNFTGCTLDFYGKNAVNGTPDNYKAKYEGVDLSTDVTGIGRSNTYGAYVAQYADMPAVTETVEVDLEACEGKGGTAW